MKRSVIILLHIGYWIIFLLLLLIFFVLMAPIIYKNTSADKIQLFIRWVYMMLGFAVIPGVISFYTFYTLLFTRFLTRKKIAKVFIIGLLIATGSALAGELVLSYILLGPGILFTGGISAALAETSIIVFGAVMNGIVALVMKGFIDWYGDIKLKADLRDKNLEMEMALIKSQIDPHFLFNTINNIDILIEKDAVKASAYLNKLSGIMRFMLYETKAERIPLQEELLYIEKYIDLQKIRTANPDYVHYEVHGNTADLKVAPMIFIPIIENAFKHADNKKAGKVIDIFFDIKKDGLIFRCKNAFINNISTADKNGGLGKDLIEKRIKLLYPQNHSLRVNNENNMYVVSLIIYHAD